MREANEELHKACDAVIVYYGAGKDSWRLSVERERRKMRAYRDKPLLAAYTYLAPPKKDDKVIMKTIEDNVIDGLEGFSEAAMDPFHQAVNPS